MKKGSRILVLLVVAAALVVIFLLFRPDPAQKRYYKVLCLGDSLTASSYGQYPRHLKRLFHAGGWMVNVYSGARPGHTSGEYLQYLKKSDLLSKVNAHVLVLMLGTNDVRIDGDHTPTQRFQENMRAIVRLIKDHKNPPGAEKVVFIAAIPPIFHCDLPTFGEDSKRRIKEEIVPAIRKIAEEEQLLLVDIYRFFKERPELLPGIHPNREGYQAMAEFIFKQILPHIEK